jgi:hypothetical protein
MTRWHARRWIYKRVRKESYLTSELSPRIRMKGGKRKKMLIKNHIPRDVYTTRGMFKAFVSFVLMTIPQENTSF